MNSLIIQVWRAVVLSTSSLYLGGFMETLILSLGWKL